MAPSYSLAYPISRPNSFGVSPADLGGVQQTIVVNGVIYDLKIDDLTGQPVIDDLTGQYIYAERSR